MIYSKRRKNLIAKRNNRSSFRLKRNRKKGGSGVVDWIKQKTHFLDKETIKRKIKKYNQIIKDNQNLIKENYSGIYLLFHPERTKSEELITNNKRKLENLKKIYESLYDKAIIEMKQTEEREAAEKEIIRQSMIQKEKEDEAIMIQKEKEDEAIEESRCNLILKDINDIYTYNEKLKQARETDNQRDMKCINKRYTHEYINKRNSGEIS